MMPVALCLPLLAAWLAAVPPPPLPPVARPRQTITTHRLPSIASQAAIATKRAAVL